MIEPALTAEEWADVDTGEGAHLQQWPKLSAWSVVSVHGGGITIEDPRLFEHSRLLTYHTDDAVALAAICNHALPDDDPRKITRADVNWLRLRPISTDQENAQYRALQALAAKLEALLPPEPEPQ